MVDSLQGSLAAHAEPAFVDGMQRITFQLDDPAFTVFGKNAATRPGHSRQVEAYQFAFPVTMSSGARTRE